MFSLRDPLKFSLSTVVAVSGVVLISIFIWLKMFDFVLEMDRQAESEKAVYLPIDQKVLVYEDENIMFEYPNYWTVDKLMDEPYKLQMRNKEVVILSFSADCVGSVLRLGDVSDIVVAVGPVTWEGERACWEDEVLDIEPSGEGVKFVWTGGQEINGDRNLLMYGGEERPDYALTLFFSDGKLEEAINDFRDVNFSFIFK